MAAVSLSPLPQHPFPMSSRRVPLANNPNAANSPFRGATAAKRNRSTNADRDELGNDHSPAKKKQLLEISNNGARRSHNVPIIERESKIFTSNAEAGTSNAFAKKLAAAREAKQAPQRIVTEKEDKKHRADLENIKTWKRHYNKVFPTFVFYFESLPQEVCLRSSRQIAALGASEEKFFSRAVTHIVTSRPIPPSPTETEANTSQSLPRSSSGSVHGLTKTINPSLLEKVADAQSQPAHQRLKHVPDVANLKKANATWQDAEPKRAQSNNADVLHKARELGIKIWALEKFERMMATMFNEELDDSEDAQMRKDQQILAPTKPSRDADLSRLLREEKKTSTERLWGDIVPFRGYYVYVHDMDAKTKPSIVREYQKLAPEEGDWPQLRSVPMPRCPFVEEYAVKADSKAKEKEKKTAEKNEEDKSKQQPRTRAASAAVEAAKQKVPEEIQSRQPLKENESGGNLASKPAMAAPPSKSFEPPKLKPSLSNNLDSLPPHLTNSHFTFTGVSRNPGREPAASGVNPSNITSAIRSQMISSTAAAPGTRAGTSKELHHLQRRALERRSGLSNNSMPSSYMNDVRAAINNDPSANAPKRNLRRRQEQLTKIHEDGTQSDEEDNTLAKGNNAARAPKKKVADRREPKPGYCENCKDKYEDFNEHIESRKHKKFALTLENWAELDELLGQLERPLKQ